MFCAKCGKKISIFSRFCSDCGSSASGAKEGKPRRSCLKMLGIFLFFFIGIPFIIFLFSFLLPSKQDNNDFIGATGVFFLGALLFWIIIKILRRVKWLNQHFFSRRIIFLPSLAVVLIILASYSFWTYNNLNYTHSARILPLIQDSLAETAAAKIMGDSIIIGNPVPGASFTKVKISAETALKNLSSLSVSSLLADYKQSAIDWSNKILVASQNPSMWKYLSGELEDFHLSLNDNQAEELMKVSIQNIQLLKEFGDTAVKNKNREALRYIAAKLLVQEHWLKGIIFSENKFLALNPISSVWASNGNPLEVPEIVGAPVPCKQVCLWINQGKRSEADKRFLWNLYRCDWCGKGVLQTQQGAQGGQEQQTPAQTQNQGQATPQQQSENTSTATNGNAPYSYANTPSKRKLCFAGVWGQPGAYCAEQVEQMVNEIETSAIELVEGKISAQDAWVESWANFTALEAEGITTGEDVLTQKLSPTVQVFYDGCAGKGGIVGGAGTVKVGLPTTESGYTCEYKNNGNSCWDMLTYSGGRYMGGNADCPEENLIPAAPAKEPVKTTKAPAKTTAPAATGKATPKPSAPAPSSATGIWDGAYSASCTMNCEDYHCIFLGYCSDKQSPFSKNFNFDIKVRNNAVVSGIDTGAGITEDGHARNMRVMFINNNTASLNYQFSMSGGKAIVAGDLDGGYEEGVADWICSCNFSGSRTSN